jgi:hypothetical protein
MACRLACACLLSSITTISAWAQDSLAGDAAQKISYLKFSALPFFYSALRQVPNNSLWIIVHYESQWRPKSKLTYNLVADFHSYNTGVGGLSFNGAIDFVLRPQLRFYPGRKAFHGYFVGVYPMYFYAGGKHTYSANYFGGGLNTGAQFFVGRIPIEFNILYGIGWGYEYSTEYFTGEPLTTPAKRGYGGIELNIGLPIRRKSK